MKIQTISFASVAILFFGSSSLFAQSSDSGSNYLLQPSDILRVQVFQEPDLNRDLRVAQDGAIMLPLIGEITVSEKTLHEIEEVITDLYDRDYLVDPQINVSILEYSQRRVNVIGQVNKPGVVLFPPEEEMTLMQAISLAGGFNRLADEKKVKLARTLPSGETETFVINTKKMISGEDLKKWKLQKGDIIFVIETMF